MSKLLTILAPTLIFLGELLVAPELLGAQKLARLLRKLGRLTVKKIWHRLAVTHLVWAAEGEKIQSLNKRQWGKHLLETFMALCCIGVLILEAAQLYPAIWSAILNNPFFIYMFRIMPIITTLVTLLAIWPMSASIALFIFPPLRDRVSRSLQDKSGCSRILILVVVLLLMYPVSPILLVLEILYVPTLAIVSIGRDFSLLALYGLIQAAYRLTISPESRLRSIVLTTGVTFFVVGNVLQIGLALLALWR